MGTTNDQESYFTREIEFTNGLLQINQSYIGDVGHVVWDAAIVLSKFLDGKYFEDAEGRNVLASKSIVELGSGTGLVGMVAAMKGASVHITDLEELLPLMKRNIQDNQKMLTGKINAETLKWGEEMEMKMKADVILIADCVYYEESLEPLVNTMKSLCQPRSVVYMSYEERQTEHKIELEKKFFKLVEVYFSMERIPLEEQDEMYRSEDIHILKMKPL